jgi:DNA-binding MarR family transcriptional regulator
MIDMGTTENAPLGYLLHQVMATLRPEVAAALTPFGLSLPEFVCMRMLSMAPGASSAELARLGNVSPQAMNTVLHRLENAQQVTRPASVASGRALPASLTGDGRTLLRRAESAVREADARVLAKLSASEQREFKRMLETLAPD